MEAARGRSSWLTTGGIGILAFIPRLYASLAWAREPVWDGHYYDFGARQIASGVGYADEALIGGVPVWHPWCHYPVGYSGFLAGLYAVFGSGQHVAPIANAVVGALVVALTHRVGLCWLSWHRALVAAVLCAVNLELIFYSPLVMTELLSTLGPLAAIWIAAAQRSSHPWRGAVLSGVVLGLSTLVRPQTILFAPVLGLAFGPGRTPFSPRSITNAAIVLGVGLAVVAPWTYRNCRVMDGCAFVSTNGGWNLAIGALPRATGRFETLRASDGCEVVTGQVQQDRCWASVGADMIRSDSQRWLALIPKKLGHCFDHSSFPVEYLRKADPEAWPEPVRVGWRKALTAVHWVLLSVASFGMVARTWRNRRDLIIETLLMAIAAGFVAHAWTSDVPMFWPLTLVIVVTGWIPRRSRPEAGPVGHSLLAMVVLFVLTHAVFFGEDRYKVPLIPVLCLLAAAALRQPARTEEDRVSLRT